jgi:hypothetical protein
LTGYINLFFFLSLSFSRIFSLSSHFSPFSPSVLGSLPLFSVALVTFYVLHSSPLSSVDFLVAFGLTVGLGFGLGVVVEPWVCRGSWVLGSWRSRGSWVLDLGEVAMGLGFVLGLLWVLGEHSEEEKRNEEREKKVKIK